jgi:isopenicillin-N epimerase
MLTANCKELFSFPERATYLDHGSYGVAPTEVLNARITILGKTEEFPAPFFAFDYHSAWRKAAAVVAQRISARPEDLALVDNVTDGINAVLRSLSFRPGDEILVTSLSYGAIVRAAKYIAGRHGARVCEVALRFPEPNPQQCIEAVKNAITPQTKLAILDHITSGTALVLPLAEMVAVCRERGVAVLVDGAHAPGQVPLDVPSIKADWYAANLHKWCFVPRGCGFLWADRSRQKGLVPNVLSWDIDKAFPHSFAWTGTRDPSAWLTISAAFDFMDRFGEDNVIEHNHRLILEGVRLLAEAWKVNLKTPDSMIASMCLVPLLDGLPFAATDEGRRDIQRALWDSARIMVSPSFAYEGRIWLRLSAQIYNNVEDYARLAAAIKDLCVQSACTVRSL